MFSGAVGCVGKLMLAGYMLRYSSGTRHGTWIVTPVLSVLHFQRLYERMHACMLAYVRTCKATHEEERSIRPTAVGNVVLQRVNKVVSQGVVIVVVVCFLYASS
jgi:hypothetical protein